MFGSFNRRFWVLSNENEEPIKSEEEQNELIKPEEGQNVLVKQEEEQKVIQETSEVCYFSVMS